MFVYPSDPRSYVQVCCFPWCEAAGMGGYSCIPSVCCLYIWVFVSVSLHLQVRDGGLTLVCAYAPNYRSAYPAFFELLVSVFKGDPPDDSIVLLGDINAHVTNDSKMWRSLIRLNGMPHLNLNAVLLLDIRANKRLSIMSIMFKHKDVHISACACMHHNTLDHRLMINFLIALLDLQPHVLDTWVIRGADRST